MGLTFLALLAVLFLRDVEGLCFGGTRTATTSLNTLSVINYSNNEDCTFIIRPTYSTGYYLEIKWLSFNIEGNMPSCSYDSVEVSLTSSYNSTGKFCSGNMRASLPFNMYSHDGHAKIRFTSDSSNTRTGFSLTYQLKSKSSNPLGGYLRSTCYYTSGKSGVFYPSGWPKGFVSTGANDYCFTKYYTGSNKLKIAIMDLDLDSSSSYCSSYSPYFQIRGSSSSYSTKSGVTSYTSSVSPKLCGSSSPRSYTTNYNYVYLYFNKPRGSSSRRGLVVGYVEYGSSSSWSSWSSWSNWSDDSSSGSSSSGSTIGSAVGSIIGLIILVAFIRVCCKYCCSTSREEVIVHHVPTQPDPAPIIIANVSMQQQCIAPPGAPGYTAPPGAPGYTAHPGAAGYTAHPGAPGYTPHPGAPGYTAHPGAPGYIAPQSSPGYMASASVSGGMQGAPPPYTASPLSPTG